MISHSDLKSHDPPNDQAVAVRMSAKFTCYSAANCRTRVTPQIIAVFAVRKGRNVYDVRRGARCVLYRLKMAMLRLG